MLKQTHKSGKCNFLSMSLADC